MPFPPGDLTTAPRLPASALEVVSSLPSCPGNVAVSKDERVFFTFHPEGGFPVKVAEAVRTGGATASTAGNTAGEGDQAAGYRPFPSAAAQTELFDTVLSLKVDTHDVLWTLDFADHALFARPRLLAFALSGPKAGQVRGFADFVGFAEFASYLLPHVNAPSI